MRLRLERSLQAWSREAGYHYVARQSSTDLNILATSCSMQRLRAYGYSTDAAVTAASFYGQTLEDALCFATDLRVLCWYWPNGDKIVFPINSNGSVYIGNSPEFWFDCYPFLQREGAHNAYRCGLDVLQSKRQHQLLLNKAPLYIGGQTHFGHFIVDKLAHLCALLSGSWTQADFGALIIPPGHKGITHDLLCFLHSILHPSQIQALIDGLPEYPSYELPCTNGIAYIGTAWVPSDNHRPDSIRILNELLYQSRLAKKYTADNKTSLCSSKSKAAYLSRFPRNSQHHDRIANYTDFKLLLNQLGVDYIFPTPYSLEERIQVLSQYDVIISDSGSCSLNGMLFTRPDASIYQIQGTRLLHDSTPLATSQLYKALPLIGSRLFSLNCEPAAYSDANSWYDKVIIDLNLIKSLVH